MSEDRRTRWITLLEAEIARRHAETLEAAGGDPREQLLATAPELAHRIVTIMARLDRVSATNLHPIGIRNHPILDHRKRYRSTINGILLL